MQLNPVSLVLARYSTAKFYTCGAPTDRSVAQMTKVCKLRANDKMVYLSLIWQLGHIGQETDVFAEPPYKYAAGPCTMPTGFSHKNGSCEITQ